MGRGGGGGCHSAAGVVACFGLEAERFLDDDDQPRMDVRVEILNRAFVKAERRFQARVAKLRTPDLPDPILDPVTLRAVEGRYLRECFEVQPVVEAELASVRPTPQPGKTRRRGQIATEIQ